MHANNKQPILSQIYVISSQILMSYYDQILNVLFLNLYIGVLGWSLSQCEFFALNESQQPLHEPLHNLLKDVKMWKNSTANHFYCQLRSLRWSRNELTVVSEFLWKKSTHELLNELLLKHLSSGWWFEVSPQRLWAETQLHVWSNQSKSSHHDLKYHDPLWQSLLSAAAEN